MQLPAIRTQRPPKRAASCLKPLLRSRSWDCWASAHWFPVWSLAGN